MTGEWTPGGNAVAMSIMSPCPYCRLFGEPAALMRNNAKFLGDISTEGIVVMGEVPR